MARISYVDIADVTDPEIRASMENAFLRNAGETWGVYAHSPTVFKYFTGLPRDLREKGTLGADLLELVRVRVATTWERLFKMEEAGEGCHY